MSISLRVGARRLQKLPSLKYYNVLKWESKFTLRLNSAQNKHYFKKMLQIKVVRKSISYIKLRECICLSPTGVKLGGSKDWHL